MKWWQVGFVAAGFGCAVAAGNPATPVTPTTHEALMLSPRQLAGRYLSTRHLMFRSHPHVVVCFEAFSADAIITFVEQGFAASIRTDTTCRTRSATPAETDVLVLDRIAIGPDTSRIFATYYLPDSPREWREEFVWFTTTLPGDWRIILGQFAPVD